MPRHPSYLLKIKITILDIFYSSLSLSLFLFLSLSLHPSFSLSLSLFLTGEEGVCTLASIKYAHTYPLHQSERERGREREHKTCPHFKHFSFSQSVSMRDYYIKTWLNKFLSDKHASLQTSSNFDGKRGCLKLFLGPLRANAKLPPE